jgi:hypothetical protein
MHFDRDERIGLVRLDQHNPADPPVQTTSSAPKPLGLQQNGFCRDHRRYPIPDRQRLCNFLVSESPRTQNRLRSDPEPHVSAG